MVHSIHSASLVAENTLALELQLLLAVVRRCLHPDNDAELRTLLSTQALNWDSLLEAAHDHGLTPLLSSELLTDFPDALPQATSERLRAELGVTMSQSLLLAGELVKVVKTLTRAGIDTLAYKGPTLALLLYQNIGMRQFCDVDILIRRSDFGPAKAALLKAGYELLLTVPPTRESEYVATGCEMPFSTPRLRALIELQWQILPHYYCVPFDIGEFFEREQPIELGGEQLQTLSSEDLALVLLVHGTKHCWGRLSWLLDLAVLTSSQMMDWRLVQARARQLGIERLARIGFRVASALLDVVPPGPFRSSLPGDSRLTRRMVENTLCEYPKLGDREPVPAKYFLYQIAIRERWRDRLRFVVRLVFTPSMSDWAMISLPRVLFPVSLLLRLLRICRQRLGSWRTKVPAH